MVNDAQDLVQSPPHLDVRNNENCTNESSNNLDRGVKVLEYKGVLWTCSLREICLTALWLPLGALIFCYVTANIFQSDDIHETHCRIFYRYGIPNALLSMANPVMICGLYLCHAPLCHFQMQNSYVYNVVPSISAITGISPQRYVWRVCIAFHLGPRLLIGCLYYNYHKERTTHIIDEKARTLATQLGDACYWLNFVELFALTGVTYVSNRENYFVHEKIFIVFMVTSLLHMLCRAKVGCIASNVVAPVRTNRLVWMLFAVAITATFGLVVFFLRHRLLCRPLAFTWFSVCEYILATANMAFHAVVVQDLPLHQLQVVNPPEKNEKKD